MKMAAPPGLVVRREVDGTVGAVWVRREEGGMSRPLITIVKRAQTSRTVEGVSVLLLDI